MISLSAEPDNWICFWDQGYQSEADCASPTPPPENTAATESELRPSGSREIASEIVKRDTLPVKHPPTTDTYRACTTCNSLVHSASKFLSCEKCRSMPITFNSTSPEVRSRNDNTRPNSVLGMPWEAPTSPKANTIPQLISSPAAPMHTPIRTPMSKLKSTRTPGQFPNSTSLHTLSPLRISVPSPAYSSYQDLTPLVEDLKTRLDNFLVNYTWWVKVQTLAGSGFGQGNHGLESSASRLGSVLEDNADQEHKKNGEEQVASVKSSNETPGAFNKIGSTSAQLQTNIVTLGSNDDTKPVPNTTASVGFNFVGEYSIIAPKENAEGKAGLEQTWRRVAMVVREIQRRTGLKFKCVLCFEIISA